MPNIGADAVIFFFMLHSKNFDVKKYLLSNLMGYMFLKYILVVLKVKKIIEMTTKENNFLMAIKKYFEKNKRFVISRRGNL